MTPVSAMVSIKFSRGKFSRPATGYECVAHAPAFDRGVASRTNVDVIDKKVNREIKLSTGRGGSRIFLGGGALVSCSTSTPINHIVFFGRIPVVLENHRSSQGGGGGGAHPLHPPPRSAPDRRSTCTSLTSYNV